MHYWIRGSAKALGVGVVARERLLMKWMQCDAGFGAIGVCQLLSNLGAILLLLLKKERLEIW